nr:TPA_asm: hypothetical protein HUJ06_018918 [Nelumbo nucifera]
MEKSSHTLLPTSPMLYAVISDPTIVDKPDITSYQPHVHGRCDLPALIPLQMNAISVEVDCYLDTGSLRLTDRGVFIVLREAGAVIAALRSQ